MPDTFKKVRDGEKLRIPARTYNAMIDAAADYANRKNNLDAESKGLSDNIVYVKNNTGAAVDRLNILGINNIIIPPTDNNFKNTTVFEGVVPLTANHSNGRFIITAEPIANNSIGKAYATGCVPVQVYIYDQTHNFADILNNDKTKLKSTPSGQATILWKESGTGTKWAVIRFGAAPPSIVRRAKLTAPAGDGNTITANLYDADGIEQTSGDEAGVTVYCNINKQQPSPFGTHLSSCIPRLYSGEEITVIKLPCRIEDENHLGTYITVYRWYCTTVFQIMATDFLDVDTTDGYLYVKLEVCE
jgi:hypothetical protein